MLVTLEISQEVGELQVSAAYISQLAEEPAVIGLFDLYDLQSFLALLLLLLKVFSVVVEKIVQHTTVLLYVEQNVSLFRHLL